MACLPPITVDSSLPGSPGQLIGHVAVRGDGSGRADVPKVPIEHHISRGRADEGAAPLAALVVVDHAVKLARQAEALHSNRACERLGRVGWGGSGGGGSADGLGLGHGDWQIGGLAVGRRTLAFGIGVRVLGRVSRGRLLVLGGRRSIVPPEDVVVKHQEATA